MSNQNNDRNQNQNRGRRNHGRGRDQRRNDQPTVYAKGEIMPVTWIEKHFDSGTRVMSYTADNIPIYPGLMRYRPKASETHNCSVKFKKNAAGRETAFALPVIPEQVGPGQWLPIEELRHILTAELTFQKKPDGRLIAFHEGRAVFPDDGTDVVLGRKLLCLLRDGGNVVFAIPVKMDAVGGTGTGLMKLDVLIAEKLTSRRDLAFVVLRKAQPKPGLRGRPTCEADLVPAKDSSSYKSIYEILSNQDKGIVITEHSSEGEVKKAFASKAWLHPDQRETALRKEFVEKAGMKEIPFVVLKDGEFQYEALVTARDRALELINLKKEDGQKRRQPREARKDQQSEAPSVPVETAPVEAPAESVALAKEAPVEVEAQAVEVKTESEPVVEAPKAEAASESDPEAAKAKEEDAEIAAMMAKHFKTTLEVVTEAMRVAKEKGCVLEEAAAPIQKHYINEAKRRVGAVSGNKGRSQKQSAAAPASFQDQLAAAKANLEGGDGK